MTVASTFLDAPKVIAQKESGTVQKTSASNAKSNTVKKASIFSQNTTKTVVTASTGNNSGCDFWGGIGGALKGLACGIGGVLKGGLNIFGKLFQVGGSLLGSLGSSIGNTGFGGLGSGLGLGLGGLGLGGAFGMSPVGWPFGMGSFGFGFGSWGCGFPALFKGHGCNWSRPTYIARGFNPGLGRIPSPICGIGSGCASNNPLGHYWGHYGKSNVFGFDTNAFGYN